MTFQLPSRAFGNGAYDYLLKPFEREQLIFAVRRALEYRHLKLENRELQAQVKKLAKQKLVRRVRK
jgi:DNA-binding NtrC family response regulator